MSVEAAPVYLVRGADPTGRSQRLRDLVNELVGTDEPSMAITELTVAERRAAGASTDAGESTSGSTSGSTSDRAGDRSSDRPALVTAALDALRTFPFGTQRRIIVIRNAGQLLADDLAAFVTYLHDPEPTSVLVLELGEKAPSAALGKAVKAVGGIEVDAPSKVADALAEHAEAEGVRLDAAAKALVVAHLGEDVARVASLVASLASTFGSGARIGELEVTPYLGDAGSVPVFELTNAIDTGDTTTALQLLHRLMQVGLHPLQIMATLHAHYRRLLRLDDPEIRTDDAAVAALKELTGRAPHPFVAKKARQQAQALGHRGVVEAYEALSRADLDLRGGSRVPDDTVLTLLVSRLAGISKRNRRTPAGPGAGSASRPRTGARTGARPDRG